MLLKELKVERAQWGDHKGKHFGKVTFDGVAGEVTLNLTPDLCNKIFAICAEGLIDTAKEAASNLTCNIIEHQKSIGIDA